MSQLVYTTDADNPYSFGNLERSQMHFETGFVTTTLLNVAGKTKIISYDFPKMVKYSAICTMFIRGTLFNLDKAIYQCMLFYILSCAAAAVGLQFNDDIPDFEAKSLPTIVDVSTNIQRLCPFLFGLFTSIVLSRWWTLRTMGVGAMDDHLINISGLLIGFACRILPRQEDWELFRSIHSKIVKYGLSSLNCIAMESRGGVTDQSLQKLVESGMLNAEEKAILLKCPQQSVALWSWISALASECLEMMKIAAPNHNMLFQEVRMGILGIHCVHEHINTQLPFPYVHMIVLLVNLNNVVMSVVAGLKCSCAVNRGEYVGASLEILQIFLVPLLYQALLQVAVFLCDPLGDDIIDFPILNFQLEVIDACAGQLSARDLYDHRRREKRSPLPNAHVETSLGPKKEESKPAAPVQLKDSAQSQEQFAKLDRRLETLAQSLSSLATNVANLQGQIANRAGQVILKPSRLGSKHKPGSELG